MSNKKVDIAVIVEAPVQYFSIKSSIDELLNSGKTVDVIVPDIKGYPTITRAARDLLSERRIKFLRSKDGVDREYKVCLASYPVINFMNIKAKYRIRYGYSILTAKPFPVFLPEFKLWFDAIICHGKQEADLMKAYTETYNISPMKYDGFKKVKHDGRPILLYLPTYGEISSADFAEDIINELKDSHRIIVRMHAHTAHKRNEEEASRYKAIKKIADEVCDDTTPLTDWLSMADVVLSDNSGSIYEAIYSETPVAIFAKDVSSRKFGNILPTHAKLVQEGVIPYTNNIKDLKSIIKMATSSRIYKKQQLAREEYFNTKGDGVGEFVKIINSYLDDRVNQEKWWIHQNYADQYHQMIEEINNLKLTKVLSDERSQYLEQQIDHYSKAKGHRFVSRLYDLNHRIRNLKK